MTNKTIKNLVPLKVGEASYIIPKLSFNKNKGILNPVTRLMENFGTEAMI